MAPEDGGRRCLRCDRYLVDLSELTEPQVDELRALARIGGAQRVCAKVSLDADGAPIYRRRAVRRLVQAAAGVVISVSLAACDTESDERARTSEPAVEMEPLPESAPANDPPAAPSAEAEAQPEPEPEPQTKAQVIETSMEAQPRRRPRPRPTREEDPIVGLLD